MSHVVAVRLSEGEWNAFQQIRDRHNISAQQLLHGIIIDALVEDGFDALRCREPERYPGNGEEGESRGEAET